MKYDKIAVEYIPTLWLLYGYGIPPQTHAPPSSISARIYRFAFDKTKIENV